MVLPLVKLGALVLKTVSKPIATRLKVEAARHPRFRNHIVNFAQANHKFSINLQRRIYGHSTNVAIHPLDEEKAIQDATDLLGELFVFSVGGAIVIFEVQRSSRSEARKELTRNQELEAFRQKDDEFALEFVLLKQRFDELEKHASGQGLSGLLSTQIVQGAENKNRIPAAPT